MPDVNDRVDSTLDGRYHIEKQLGAGGMGVVYRARDTKLGRTVALKFLASHLTLDEESKERFIQEARAASALDHANIGAIYDVAETPEGDLYIVMAFYEGETLGHRLRESQLSVEACLDVGLQLALALEAAHEAGIIHRDLKPANVFLTARDEVKLLDFGLAKLATAGKGLTKTGSTLGTAGYMSPEQIDGREIDARADLFSFGALLYEMLAGRKAFEGDSAISTAVAVLQTEPPPLSALRSEVDAEIAALVEKCLKKNAADRPANASEIVSALGGTPGRGPGAMRVPTPAGQASLARPSIPRWLLPAGLVVTVLGAVFAGSRFFAPTPAVGELDPDLVAVLPFRVSGSPDLAYLGEGLVDLLSAKLNGAGTIRTPDPRAVIARANDEGDLGDPLAGRRVASALGAGRYVSGEVLQAGGQVTLSATLHGTDAADGAGGSVSASGSLDDLFTMLDGLAADLIAGAFPGEVDRMRRMATLTTPSLEAAKEYLVGEQLLRAGMYREAAEAYDRAVRIDSTFALAYYRKSIAADWTDAYDVRSSADRALSLSGVLSARDQAVLQALQLRRNGRVVEAEQKFREVVRSHPNDVEGWVQFGEAIFHDTSRRGGSTLDAVEPLGRAVALEPNNLMAQLHVARLYALFDSIDALRRTAEHVREVWPDSERTLEVESIYAYMIDDPALQAEVRRKQIDKPGFYQFFSAHGVARFARDPHGAAEILAVKPPEDPYVMALRPGIAVERGKYAEAYRYLAELRGLGNSTWDVMEAVLLTSGALPFDPERARSVADRIERASPDDIHRTSFIPPYEDLTVAFTGFQRDYFLALLWIQLDRADDARRLLDDMRGRPGFVGLGTLKADAERSLQGELLLKRGDQSEALDVFRTMEYEVPHAATVWPLADLSRSRFLRAELEREAGEIETAKRFYVGLDEPWSFWDSYFRPLVYERLGALAEDEGNLGEAVSYYSRIVEYWREADPEVQPLREDILDRLDRLVNEGQRSVGSGG